MTDIVQPDDAPEDVPTEVEDLGPTPKLNTSDPELLGQPLADEDAIDPDQEV